MPLRRFSPHLLGHLRGLESHAKISTDNISFQIKAGNMRVQFNLKGSFPLACPLTVYHRNGYRSLNRPAELSSVLNVKPS